MVLKEHKIKRYSGLCSLIPKPNNRRIQSLPVSARDGHQKRLWVECYFDDDDIVLRWETIVRFTRRALKVKGHVPDD